MTEAWRGEAFAFHPPLPASPPDRGEEKKGEPPPDKGEEKKSGLSP